MDIDRVIEIVRSLKEEAPTVSVSGGGVAGITGEPPVYPKKKEPTILGRRCFPGARTRWKGKG